MDSEAEMIIEDYIEEHTGEAEAEVYCVWKCKTLQNRKYLFTTHMGDGMYYELTYNGDKNEWYLDVYRKVENRVVPGFWDGEQKNT